MSDELEEHPGDWHMGYLAGHAAAEAVYEAAKKAPLDRRSYTDLSEECPVHGYRICGGGCIHLVSDERKCPHALTHPIGNGNTVFVYYESNFCPDCGVRLADTREAEDE